MTPDEINRMIELLLFSDDLTAKTEEQIGEAVQKLTSVFDPHDTHHIRLELRKSMDDWAHDFEVQIPRRDLLNDCWDWRPGLWAWKHRAGKAYQHDLEAHIAAYRRPARNFYGNPVVMMLAIEKMHERKIHLTITSKPGFEVGQVDSYQCRWHNHEGCLGAQSAPTLPAAVAMAIVEAIGQVKK